MLLVSWGGNKSGDLLDQYLMCTETIHIEGFIACNYFSNAFLRLPIHSLLPVLDSVAFET